MLALSIVASIGAVSTVGAEIEGPPTTSWGVDTLLTGTQNDSIKSYVFAIEQIGDRIYVGGRFGDVTSDNASFAQPYLAAFDANTGVWISSFTPNLNGSVNALQASPDGSRLFVGGDFSSVNGQSANMLVALDPTTGAVDSGFAGQLTSATVVRDFHLDGQWLYVVGGFNGVSSPIGNNLAQRAARFDWQSGNHDPNWRPMVTGGTPWGVSVSSADRVYLAGDFTTVGGNSVTGGFAAVTKTDATYVPPSEPFPINTTNTGRQYLYDVEVVNGYIFVGGSEHFVAVLNESDQSLHRFHYSRPKGDFQDLEVVGDRVYAGCHCRADAVIDSSDDVLWFSPPPAGVQNGTVDITNDNTWITAFSAVTGEVDGSFNPPITAFKSGVWAIHGSSDGCLWAGGDITGSAGQPSDNLIRLCDPATLDTERPSVPGAPQEVAQGVDSVDLTWLASTDNVAVTGYNVYDNTTNQIVATSATNSVTVTGLTGTNTFYLKAFDAAGNLSWRSGTTTIVIGPAADTQRPSVPGMPQEVSQGADTLDLTWNPSTDNVAVTGYNIYNADTNQIVATSATNSVTITGLTPGTLRYYGKAFDAAGNLSWRSGTLTVNFAGGADTERPSVPGMPQEVSQGADTLDLTWNPSTDNVAVTGYNIYNADTNQIVATSATNSVTITGLTPGTLRYYGKAFDAAGNLSWRSGTLTVNFAGGADTQRPSTPTALTVAGVGTGSVDLAWNPSTDNVAVTGYNIYDFANNQIVATSPGPSTTVTGLTGTNTFYVKAFDAAGNTSWRSNTVTFTVQ